jgi:ethanolamine kinase
LTIRKVVDAFFLTLHRRGIWALIQATISQIDFDYAAYAEARLGEYWAWRAEVEGTREAEGKLMPLREERWSQEI